MRNTIRRKLLVNEILFISFLAVTIIVVASCCCENRKTVLKKDSNMRYYLFLGHIYQWHSPLQKIDSRLEKLNKKPFNQVWLGGDVCSESSKNHLTLKYIDKIFNLSNPKTYWAIGNHDIATNKFIPFKNNEVIKEFTKRKTFYTHYNNGFTALILNTNLDIMYQDNIKKYCEETEEQYKLIQLVSDTIIKSSHLVVLLHNVVWEELDTNATKYANYIKDKIFSCDTTKTFKNDIYPLLVKVKKKGIPVICVAGDVGYYFGKKGEFITREGVVLLGSGINNSRYKDKKKRDSMPKDKILRFNHDLLTKKLTWNFLNLDSLLRSQNTVK